MTTAERLLQEAMQLSSDERELLAIELFASLEKEPGYDEAWEAEIERRLKEIDDGTVEMIPGEQVMAELQERLRARRV
jgi:putative addiction module component (TIGR02574 family)